MSRTKVTSDVIGAGAITADALGAVEAGRFFLSTGVTITTATWSKIPIDQTTFSALSGSFSGAGRFTPSRAGKYRVTGRVYLSSVTGAAGVAIYVNNNPYTFALATGTGDFGLNVVDLVSFNGSTDYVEIWGYHASGTSVTGSAAPGPHTGMTLEYLGT